EAQRVVGDDFVARVLEPSPPTVTDGEWFADDPVAGESALGRRVVSPVPGGDVTWDAWVREHPEQAAWAAARWLGAYPRLPHPPRALVGPRLALHRLAVYVLSPARRRANGKIALRFTFGGIGTPFFGADEQVRVAATNVVRLRSGASSAEPITTLARAAVFVLDGPPDVAGAGQIHAPPPAAARAARPPGPPPAPLPRAPPGLAYPPLPAAR